VGGFSVQERSMSQALDGCARNEMTPQRYGTGNWSHAFYCRSMREAGRNVLLEKLTCKTHGSTNKYSSQTAVKARIQTYAIVSRLLHHRRHGWQLHAVPFTACAPEAATIRLPAHHPACTMGQTARRVFDGLAIFQFLFSSTKMRGAWSATCGFIRSFDRKRHTESIREMLALL